MLSNVSDDLASGMEGDRRLLTYCYVLTKNAILGMHLAFFVGTKGVHIVSLLAGTRGGVEAALMTCFIFHILILRVWISWKKSKFFSFLVRGAWRCSVLHQCVCIIYIWLVYLAHCNLNNIQRSDCACS